MLHGHSDLPSSCQELVKLICRIADTENVVVDVDVRLPTITRLRQPLLLALSVSPLIILQDIAPMSRNLKRLQMLRAWYHYGNIRPPILARIETCLWQRILDISLGSFTATEALRLFLAETYSLVEVAGPEKHFFATNKGEVSPVPFALAYKSAETPSSGDRVGCSVDSDCSLSRGPSICIDTLEVNETRILQEAGDSMESNTYVSILEPACGSSPELGEVDVLQQDRSISSFVSDENYV
ncbi:hypothetical protein VNI00_017429 [Paramarasmius palmivorus]|uniref:Uncharacterized protein n=1 Tax=Paramarasmius palmivorus TaxID=297713 RepID=A0AAW0B6Q6_9AGAR